MDRRKLKPHRGLHQNLLGPSTSTSSAADAGESEDMFSSSHRSCTSSQRQSSLQLLRKRTQTPTLTEDEDTKSQGKRARVQTTRGSPVKGPRQEGNTERPSQRESSSRLGNIGSQTREKRREGHLGAPEISQAWEKQKERPMEISQVSQRQKERALEVPQASQVREKQTEKHLGVSQKSPRRSTPVKSLRLPQVSPEKLSPSKNRDPRFFKRPAGIWSSPPESDKENQNSKSKSRASRVILSDSDDEEPQKPKEKTLFERFLDQSGIRPSLDNDEQYTISTNPAGVVKKIQEVLSGSFTKAGVLEDWKKSLEEISNMKKYLNPTVIEQEGLVSVNNVSLVRILLQVPLIQTEVLSSLLRRLNEEVLVADSLEDVPWACALLSQLRFLEIVADADTMTSSLEELLESSPDWFKRELIAYLPDIVTDSHHQSIADILCKLMETDSRLNQVILGCITGLTLGKEYLEELRDKVLLIMPENTEISEVPAMVKFCLYECPSVEVYQKVLKVIRDLELQPDDNTNNEECFTSQMIIVSTLKMTFVMTKAASKAALSILSEAGSNDKPQVLDLVMMLLLCRDTFKKKSAENVFKKHVKSGYYRASLLSSFYRDYEQVAKDFQPTALSLASCLLKSEDQTLVNFAVEWFRHQFLAHSKIFLMQTEIINKLILLMGNNDHTARHALSVLCKMTESPEDKEQLQRHCNELTVLMEKIDKFDLEEVATMSDLLHALCTSSSSSEALKDDLFILLQKQLSNTDAVVKCKGVVGAVMAIKHLVKNDETIGQAREILRKLEISTKDCPRGQALYYDKMGQVIANDTSINQEFVKELTKSLENELVTHYMTDRDNYRGDLVPCFALNHYEEGETEDEMFIHFGESRYGAIVPALFRIVRIGYLRISENHDLEDVSAVLGTGIMMPRDLEMPNTRTLDLMFSCVNWYRELISAYITENGELMKPQVVQRLDDLMHLQGELSNTLSLAETRYQPPPCYFHRSPPPAFNRVEKKLGKKPGKKVDKNTTATGGIPEWEGWENGSLMTIKNPMYFRRLDATIVHFLDTEISKKLSSGHVCFIVKELSSMLDDDSVTNQGFIRELVELLPKIMCKLNQLVEELTEKDDVKHKQAVWLILSLLAKLFNWKGFESASHWGLLRAGLRILASQTDEANRSLKYSRELVAEAYPYFEGLAVIASQIPIAHALVNMCKTLMKHSETFTKEQKDRQAKMAYTYLCLEWTGDKHLGSLYKAAVTGLLKNWMDHEPDPLTTVSEVLEWLPQEVEGMETTTAKLTKLPTINRSNFHYLYQKLFDGLLKGAKIALTAADGNTPKLQVWRTVGKNVQLLVKVCKALPTRGTLLSYLRLMPHLLKMFLVVGMPTLEHDLRHKPEEVTGILKMMQVGTRYLNVVCCHSTQRKDMALTKLVPAAKIILEQLVYSVKGMLVMNNSSTAFWMGNLVNKNLDGQEIFSQNSTTSEDPTIPEISTDNNASSGDESVSDILGEDDDTNDTKDGSVDS
ncbi:Fanconi anemia group D2 protein [Fopius arisanus]|uniref:FANCD2 protein n=1 Tax=Fopius arisanus TaxID=64838 RepID=A0A0C9Q3F2_9HYME|nr:PREDICTED: Fanconi anemia group D2 protein [Fopius arisanus]